MKIIEITPLVQPSNPGQNIMTGPCKLMAHSTYPHHGKRRFAPTGRHKLRDYIESSSSYSGTTGKVLLPMLFVIVVVDMLDNKLKHVLTLYV
jgi:hypothetical protein